MISQKEFAKDNIAYWSQRAPGYSHVNQEELFSGQNQVWSQVLRDCIQKHNPGKRPQDLKILDIGTGPGFFSIILTRMGFSVTAIDYTARMLEEARRNAAQLNSRILFLKMDAQNLSFAPESFDVIVSRNLTWNLPQPEDAYRQWIRVLKPGGLLLNFDANWYRYLFDEHAMELHQKDRENVALSHAEDDTAGTDVSAMEAIARKASLSCVSRPAWDLEVLKKLGMEVWADLQIWKQVWTSNERINNASTPMFLIRGVKPVQSSLQRSAVSA